jgi:hypothetical protein
MDEDDVSYSTIRRRWRELNPRTAGEIWHSAIRGLVVPCGAATILGGVAVAAAALFTRSDLVWYGMFLLIGYLLINATGLSWWVAAITGFPTLLVANHTLPWLILHGGLGMLGNGFVLMLSGPALTGPLVWAAPVGLSAVGGAIAWWRQR